MIGVTMAKQLGITKADLDPSEKYLTSVRLTLSSSNKYSILLGNYFIVPIGGIVDSWGHLFRYRVD